MWYNWRTVQNYEWSWGRLIWLGKAFILYPVSLLLLVVNWHDMMKRLGASVNMASNIHTYCVNVINRRLPMGTFWSAGGRISAYNKQGVSTRIITSSLFIEFLLHGFSSFMLWVILETLGYGYISILAVVARDKVISIIVVVAIFSGTIILLLSRSKKWFREIYLLNHINKLHWIRWVLLYSFTWVNAGVMLFFVIQSIAPTTISIEQTISTWALVGLIGYIFSTFPFVDIGSKELSLAFLLSQSMPLVQAILVAVVFRLLLTVSDAIWPLSIASLLHIYNRRTKKSWV